MQESSFRTALTARGASPEHLENLERQFGSAHRQVNWSALIGLALKYGAEVIPDLGTMTWPQLLAKYGESFVHDLLALLAPAPAT